MAQRFFRCNQCGLPHDLSEKVCPITGGRIERGTPRSARGKAQSDSRVNLGKDAMPIPPSAPRPEPHGDCDLIGRIIGQKYRVLGFVGKGGMGTVFEAEHLHIGRRVAIKVLNRVHHGQRDSVARFHQEACAAGAIGHPNICEIYDVGRLDDDAPYLVMERLHGKTLAERINSEGALPFEDVVNILTQVLSALVAAHEEQIIHRDIKPENIFLAERVGCAPVVKILDFGISKSAKDEVSLSLTRTGMVMGTPFYMAPEQVRGEDIDNRVDIYACGVVLYEAITGRRPFMASNYNALIVQVLSTQPTDPREIRPAIPSTFLPIMFKSLSKKREERFDDAASFIHALNQVRPELDRRPITAEIKQLAEGIRRTSHPPKLASDAPPPDSTDIPVVFSEMDTGQQTELRTGEVSVDLESDDDPTEVGGNSSFFSQKRLAGQQGTSDSEVEDEDEDEEAHDTIVEPLVPTLSARWSQLTEGPQRADGGLRPVRPGEAEGKEIDADTKERTAQPDSERAEGIINSCKDPDGGTADANGDDAARLLSTDSSFPDDDNRRETPGAGTGEDGKTALTQSADDRPRVPRPSRRAVLAAPKERAKESRTVPEPPKGRNSP